MENNIIILCGEITALPSGMVAELFAPAAPPVWLDKGRACEFPVASTPDKSQIDEWREKLDGYRTDVFCVSARTRRKKLLLSDMDATIVEGETLDELAERAGFGPEIAAITQAAMRGELDFAQALTARVAKLAGQPETLIAETMKGMKLSNGAEDLVRTMRGNGAECVLVSGGFSIFTRHIANLCGFSNHHGNELGLHNNKLTGDIIPPILDKDAKRAFLHSYAQEMGIDLSETITIGDGANDLPMLRAAQDAGGLGIGYHPKPLLRAELMNCIIHSDLRSVLYMQGFAAHEILRL